MAYGSRSRDCPSPSGGIFVCLPGDSITPSMEATMFHKSLLVLFSCISLLSAQSEVPTYKGSDYFPTKPGLTWYMKSVGQAGQAVDMTSRYVVEIAPYPNDPDWGLAIAPVGIRQDLTMKGRPVGFTINVYFVRLNGKVELVNTERQMFGSDFTEYDPPRTHLPAELTIGTKWEDRPFGMESSEIHQYEVIEFLEAFSLPNGLRFNNVMVTREEVFTSGAPFGSMFHYYVPERGEIGLRFRDGDLVQYMTNEP